MKTLIVALGILGLVGCAAPEATADAPAETQASSTLSAECIGEFAQVVYEESREEVAHSVIATIHTDSAVTYQLPAFDQQPGRTVATVSCFTGSYAVFTKTVSQ